MAFTFSKIIFGVLFIGILFTGFVKFGGDISQNSNLDSRTAQYLSNINSSIQNIEALDVNITTVELGEDDSFSKQYKEAKLYAQTASGLVSTAGDTPDILIKTLDVEEQENAWFIKYLYLGVSLMLMIVFLGMLFGGGKF